MGVLDARVVLVTGAARRVGAAIARELHAAGAAVALHYRHAVDEAAALAAELNEKRAASASALAADLLSPAAPRTLVAEVLAQFGRLDGLVNNASSFFPAPLAAIDQAQWDDLIGTNLRAPLFLAQAAAPELTRQCGAIVNIVDIHAERPLAGYLLYSVAKSGLVGLTRALAQELAPAVRVNAVAPGAIAWPEDDANPFDTAERARIVGQTLLRRTGDPADIAAAVRFLLAEAPYVTGQIFNVDGGRSIVL